MRTWFKILGWVGGILGVLALLAYIFLVDTWRIPSDDPLEAASILPTLAPGDLVLVSRHKNLSRGDLLRCPDPDAPGRWVIGRAMAQAGETITIDHESLTIDRTHMTSPRACDPPHVTVHDPQKDDDIVLDCSVEEWGELDFGSLHSGQFPEPPSHTTVDHGWYLLSDDRHIHLDSRDFGAMDPTACQHIVFRIVSKDGFGDAKHRLSVIW